MKNKIFMAISIRFLSISKPILLFKKVGLGIDIKALLNT